MQYLPHFTVAAVLNAVLVIGVVACVLMTKKDSTAAIAWSLVVILMPVVGALVFWVFGINHVYRPLRKKQRHRSFFGESHPPRVREAMRWAKQEPNEDPQWGELGHLAVKLGAFPICYGNTVQLYGDTNKAFAAILEAIRAAKIHIHLEYFIVRDDATGQELLRALIDKAREGVAIRFLYDSMGSRKLKGSFLKPLIALGGKVAPFLPLNILRSRMQINMRNHRKIVVVDGRVGFTGGMNIGDEYLCKSKCYGFWRDQMVRLEGPAVAGFQRIFIEDWDFACRETLVGPDYFPEVPATGDTVVQVIESGPDQAVNGLREMYFAAIVHARERLWIASPYFVPDSGLLDALRLALYRGVDVRFLTLLRPDHYMAFHAAHYYWTDMLAAGMKIYQYRKGMMHSKLLLVDGAWGLVTSANFDNRSLHLNFEAGCILYSPPLIAELEEGYRRDLKDSQEVDLKVFANRPFTTRLKENACRLLTPVL